MPTSQSCQGGLNESVNLKPLDHVNKSANSAVAYVPLLPQMLLCISMEACNNSIVILTKCVIIIY